MNKFALILVAFLVAAASGVVRAQECAVVEDWKINSEEYPVSDLYINGPSFGVWTDPYEHIEYMWIHHNVSIDFYDLTSSAGKGPSGDPVLAYSIPSGSTCSQATTFMYGNELITYHGDTPLCTCKWTESNKCPHRIELNIPGQPTQQIALGINSVLNVDTITPDVTGAAGLGYDADPVNPNYSCFPLINPQDVAGKYCIVDRGGCLFQTKYENCRAAGAIGTIIVNRLDAVITLPVFQVDPGDVLVMATKSEGQIIKDNIDTVSITIGRGTGPAAPVQGYSEPDALGVVNPWTGDFSITDSAFILVDDVLVDYKRGLMYGLTVDGNLPSQVMVLDLSGPTDATGTYPVLGVFPQGADGTYWDIMYTEDDRVILLETSWVEDNIYIYDATDNPASPTLISTIKYDSSWCPGGTQPRLSGVEVHPKQRYIYVMPGLRRGDCPNNDNWILHVYDLIDPANPVQVNAFNFPYMDVGSSFVSVNGLKWAWGPNDVAALPMASSGLVFYDFTNPIFPYPKTAVYDPAVNVGDFTAGMYATVYGDNGYWIAYEKDGADGVHGIWHALKLVC